MGGIRSGRTTRMLHDAKRLADDGHAVYVIAANGPQASEFRRELSGQPGIKVEVRPPEGFNWYTMRVNGSHPNCVFLVDHYAIENKFDTMLKMLHMYDRPMPSEFPDESMEYHHGHGFKSKQPAEPQPSPLD